MTCWVVLDVIRLHRTLRNFPFILYHWEFEWTDILVKNYGGFIVVSQKDWKSPIVKEKSGVTYTIKCRTIKFFITNSCMIYDMVHDTIHYVNIITYFVLELYEYHTMSFLK